MFLPGFRKVAESDWKDYALPASAAAATYLAMRHPSSAANVPKELRKLRLAAAKHGITRVHLHNKKPGSFRRFFSEVAMPADKHVHLTSGKSYSTGHKTKSVVFDPDMTERFNRTSRTLGWSDKTTKQIEKGKLEEYRKLKQLGLKTPETKRFTSHRSLKADEVVKPNTGSQSRVVLTKKDFENFGKDKLLLKNFKAVKRGADKLLKSNKIDVDQHMAILNRHPGWKQSLVERALRSPHKFVKQKKIDIASEFRVHAFRGQPLGVTSPRHLWDAKGYFSKGEAERAATKLLKKVKPELRENLLALDIAKDRKGKWHVIETNPGPDSGILTPAKLTGFWGPHKLYKQVTGRYPVSTSAIAAGAAGVGTVFAQKKADS